MEDISFGEVSNPGRAANIVDFLRKPRLWIPTKADYGESHSAWLEKTEAELSDGTRHALFAKTGSQTVGAVVFRQNQEKSEIVDIRNISISPDTRGRYFGAFLLRNSEYLAKEVYPQLSCFTVDTKLTNHSMRSFLKSQDYQEKSVLDLYDSGRQDVVLKKQLGKLTH